MPCLRPTRYLTRARCDKMINFGWTGLSRGNLWELLLSYFYFWPFEKWQNGNFCPNVPNFGTVGNGSEDLTSQLWDRWRRSRSLGCKHIFETLLIWNDEQITFWLERCYWIGKSEIMFKIDSNKILHRLKIATNNEYLYLLHIKKWMFLGSKT